MTVTHEEVRVRWLRGLGDSPGGVDLAIALAPDSTWEKAVTVIEALAVAALIDFFCPTSRLYERVARLAAYPMTTSGLS